MRNQSIVAGWIISVALVVTTNAQNHSPIGQSRIIANGKSANRTPHNSESTGTIKESTNLPEDNEFLFDLSRFDEAVVNEFKKAWSCSGNGINSLEGAVLIYRFPNHVYKAKFLGCSSERNRVSFRWNPSAIAIVHTHPNGREARPSEPDIRIADRYGVPIFTLTNRGMFMYHPATRETSKVMEGFNWLNPSKWQPELVSRRHSK